MNQPHRSNLIAGLLILLVGLWLLASQLFPGIKFWINAELSWPFFIIGAGLLILVLGILFSIPEMAVPACIVGGIGCLLYWQNLTGNWESWAYAWALIPGFSGVGVILSGLLKGQLGPALRSGVSTIIFSLILFAIFASFLGGWQLLGVYWPVLLIVLGIWMLLRLLIRI